MPSTSRGSRRDFAALEARRYAAARLFARGESQAAVARTLGATRAAAHRWFHAWQDEGRTALKAAGRAGAQAAARGVAARAGRSGIAQGPRGAWLRHGTVDVAARRHAHRAAHRRAVPPGTRLVHPSTVGLVAPTPDAPGARAGRGGDPPVEARALAAGKKNARRRRAWIVFEDESGVS